MNSDSKRSTPVSADSSAETASDQLPAARFVPLPRRVFGLRLLGAVPLAIAAAAAVAQPETVQAGTDGDWTLTGNSLPDATKFLGSTNAQALTIKTSNTTRMTITSSGNVGIGTAAPANKFHVLASNTAIRGDSTSTTGTPYGVHGKTASPSGRGVFGEATSSGTGTSYGVYGKSASIDGRGVFGEATSSSGLGNPYGVYGKSTSPEGRGVVGEATGSYGIGVDATGSTVGVYGYALSTNGTGVYGAARAENGTTTYGVEGFSYSPDGTGVRGDGGYGGVVGRCWGTNGGGVIGIGSGGGTPYGVYGYIDHQFGGYAGYFDGNVEVAGTLSKTAGSFRIDHPQDPANQYLSHSFVESPDMMNVYNGNVTLGADGSAEVTLPAYFEALNRDFRYQLTAIGAPGPNLHVARKIANNRFTIAGGEAGMEVSWQITGVRDDAYARAHPIPVEQPKPEHERGTYLTPKEHGQPEAKHVHYERIQKLLVRAPESASPGVDPAR